MVAGALAVAVEQVKLHNVQTGDPFTKMHKPGPEIPVKVRY